MNDLEKYFSQNTGRVIYKWKHYFEIYERHFSRFRGADVCIVEFGVYQGGSLQMWKHYFGPRCRIFGIDINPQCKAVEEEQIEILVGDQEDRNFLRSLTQRIPRIDILIDDGGHTMKQQINTYEELFPHIDANGVYLCEDVHTSYWRRGFGGGVGRSGSFIEYSKDFIDYLNAWHSLEPRKLDITQFTRSVHSLHYYDSVLVIEKRPISKPAQVQSGKMEIQNWTPPRKGLKRLERWLKPKLKRLLGRR